MRRVLTALTVIALSMALYACAYTRVNGVATASPRDVSFLPAADAPAARDTLDIMVWNLGYGGLGRESDFVADGGTHTFPPSRAAVRANVAAIDALIAREAADVIVFRKSRAAGR